MPSQQTIPILSKYSSFGDYVSAHMGHLRWARKAPKPQLAAAVTDAYEHGRVDDARKLTNLFLHKATAADAGYAVGVANANTVARNMFPALRAYALAMGAGALTRPADIQAYCYALVISNRPREAMRIMQKAALDNPRNALFAGELANIHVLLGLGSDRQDLFTAQLDRAREWYEHATNYAPHDQTILQNARVAEACFFGSTYDKTGERVPLPQPGQVLPLKPYIMSSLQRNARTMVAGPVLVPHWYPSPNGNGGFMGTSIMIQGRPQENPQNLHQMEALLPL